MKHKSGHAAHCTCLVINAPSARGQSSGSRTSMIIAFQSRILAVNDQDLPPSYPWGWVGLSNVGDHLYKFMSISHNSASSYSLIIYQMALITAKPTKTTEA